nr:hypothetical protein [Tanacetum cinerariifolium]
VKLSSSEPTQDLSHTNRPFTPIIEEWVSDSEDDYETTASQIAHSSVQSTKQVTPPRHSVQPVEAPILADTPKPTSPNTSSSGKRKNRKTCFMCRSAQPTPRNYVHRGTHKQNVSLTRHHPQIYMVPAAVLTQSKPISTAVRPICAAVPKIMVTRPRHAHKIDTKSKSTFRRHITRGQSPNISNSSPRVTAAQASVVSAAKGKSANRKEAFGHVGQGAGAHGRFREAFWYYSHGGEVHRKGEMGQTNPFAEVVSAITGIVHQYMNQQMNEAVRVAFQIQTDPLHDAYQRENDEFLRTIDENMKRIIKEQVKVVADLSEMELKKIVIEKMEGNKSIQRPDKQRNLYKALVDAYEANKIILYSYVETVILKRRRDDDDDKDEGPSAGLDRGSKRRREGAEDQPIVQSSQHPEWFSQSQKLPTPDRDWNKTLPAIQRSTQTWISELEKQADSHSSFNELLDTLLDFSNFIMNRLRVDTLTPELLAGPTFKLMKGLCKSLIELEYHFKRSLQSNNGSIQEPIDYDKHAHWGRKHQQFYGFAVNWESARDVYSKRRIIAVTDLKIMEWHSYKHLDWITVRRDDDKLYNFKKGNFKRLRLQDIEDMLLLLVQGKLTNLTVEERFSFNVSLRMFTRSIVIQRRVEDLQLGVECYQKRLNLAKPDTYRSDMKRREAYTAYSNPRGFIYQNKDKKNRLMRIDKLHKFSDGTLTDVHTALHNHLKGIRMQYLPQTIWRKGDKDRAAA